MREKLPSIRQRSADFESLERRRLFACDVQVIGGAGFWNPGQIQISGNNADNFVEVLLVENNPFSDVDDSIEVYCEGGMEFSDRLWKPAPGSQHAMVYDSIAFRGFSGNDIFYSNVALPTTVYAGEGDDYIITGDAADVVLGEGGNDKLFTQGGNDYAMGGDGNDRIEGGAGNDKLRGEADNDLLFGEDGEDLLLGGPGIDKLYGGAQADELHGGSDIDYLFGGSGDDGFNFDHWLELAVSDFDDDEDYPIYS